MKKLKKSAAAKKILVYWIILLAVQGCVLLYDFALWPLVLTVTLMGVISSFRTVRLIDDHTDKRTKS